MQMASYGDPGYRRRGNPGLSGIFGGNLREAMMGRIALPYENIQGPRIHGDAATAQAALDPAQAGPAMMDLVSDMPDRARPIGRPDIAIGYDPGRIRPRPPRFGGLFPPRPPMGGGGGQAPTLTPQEWKMTITPAGGGGGRGGGGGGWGGGRGGGPQLSGISAGLGALPSMPSQVMYGDGGLISLAGGGYIPPYGLAEGGEIPMVYANGGYVPAFLFGGLWKGIKKVAGTIGKVALKVAPIAAIALPGIGTAAAAGIGALSGALSKKISGGSWTDALKSGIMTGAGTYVGAKGFEGASKAWGGGGSIWDKLGRAIPGGLAAIKGIDPKIMSALSTGVAVAGRMGEHEGVPAEEAQNRIGIGMGTSAAQPAGLQGHVPIPGADAGMQSTWAKYGLGDTQRRGGGMVPEYESLYANRRFGGMVPGYLVGGRFPPFRMGPAQAMPVPAAPPRLPMAPPVAPPMGPPPSMGPPPMGPPPMGPPPSMGPPPPMGPPQAMPAFPPQVSSLGMPEVFPPMPKQELPPILPVQSQPTALAEPPEETKKQIKEEIKEVKPQFSAIDEQIRKLAEQAEERRKAADAAVKKDDTPEKRAVAQEAAQVVEAVNQQKQQQKSMETIAEVAPKTIERAPLTKAQTEAILPPAVSQQVPPAMRPMAEPTPPVLPPVPEVAPPVVPPTPEVAPPVTPPMEAPMGDSPPMGPPGMDQPMGPPPTEAPPGMGLEGMADVIPETVAAAPTPPPEPAGPTAPSMPQPHQMRGPSRRGGKMPIGLDMTEADMEGINGEDPDHASMRIPRGTRKERWYDRKTGPVRTTPPPRAVGQPAITQTRTPPPAAPVQEPVNPLGGLFPEKAQPGPQIFGGGYAPGTQPRTPRQLMRAGDPGAARLVQQMNRPPVAQPEFRPPARRAEGGLLEEAAGSEEVMALIQVVIDAIQSQLSGEDDPEKAEIVARAQETLGPDFDKLVEAAKQQMSGPEMPPAESLPQMQEQSPELPIQQQALPQMPQPELPPMPQQALPQMPQQMGTDEIPMQEGGLLAGQGDGMADDVLVTADAGTPEAQPVALSKGEFIVAADVVSGLGNGNTDEGAAVLEQLQADVRMERSGSPQQPAPIDLSEVLPGTYGEQYA